MADFDPYYIWLSIPPNEQPPDHYRLLGVTRFEPNLDVISAAADRQMAHLRTYQHGARSAESQRLLNEVAKASGVLLNAESKGRYDEELKKKLEPAAVIPLTQAAPVAKVIRPAPMAVPLQPRPVQPAPLPMPAQPQPKPLPMPQKEVEAATTSAPVQAQKPSAPVPEKPASPAAAAPTPQPKIALPVKVLAIAGGALLLMFLMVGVTGFIGLRMWFAKPKPPQNYGPQFGVVRKTQREPYNFQKIDPWRGGNRASKPVEFGPGNYVVNYDPKESNLKIADLTTAKVQTYAMEQLYSRSSNLETRFESDGRPYVTQRTKEDGWLVLTLNAAKDCHVSYFEIIVPFAAAGVESRVDWYFCNRFDFQTWNVASNELLKKGEFVRSPNQLENSMISDTTSGFKQSTVYGALRLRAAENGEVKLHLVHPLNSPYQSELGHHLLARFRVSSGPAASSAPTIYQPSRPETVVNNARLTPPANFVPLMPPLKQTGDGEPLNVLLAAQAESGNDLKYALFRAAIRDAKAQGDVWVASEAFRHMQAAYAVDTLQEEITSLKSMYQEAKPAFQPIAFAAWCDRVFERLSRGGKLAEHEELIKMALACARESGDRDIIARIVLWGAQRNP